MYVTYYNYKAHVVRRNSDSNYPTSIKCIQNDMPSVTTVHVHSLYNHWPYTQVVNLEG